VIPAHELLGHQLLFWASAAAAWMLRTLLDAREWSPQARSMPSI
jgi:hypothetical protein